MRVYLISGDRPAAQDAERVLRSAGFNVFVTDLGKEAISRAGSHDCDILVLDSDPSDMSAREFLLQFRRANIPIPILILSDADLIDELSRGFGFGAEEYMTTPVTPDEVTAALRGVVRRWQGLDGEIVEAGALRIDLTKRAVELGGQRKHLDGQLYRTLELLARRKGMTVTKSELVEHLYGRSADHESKIADVFISALRKRLQPASGFHPIHTVWGRGYSLRDPERHPACT